MNNLNLLQTCQNEQSADVIYGPIQPELLREEVLADLLEASARRDPQQVALIFGEHRISYGELDRQADQVASALIKAGVRPGHIIGLWLPRGIELLVMQAGIAKAGAAWLPLDQDTPVERLQICLEDASAVGLVSCNALSPLLAGSGLSVWTAEELLTPTDAALVRRSGVLPDHPAYVIYTSGSTGLPKGVMVEHRGLRNLLDWYLDDLAFHAGDAVLLASSYNFDLTQKNILAPLMVGASLHLAEEPFNPSAIVAQVAEAGITHLNMSPSAFHALVDADQHEALACLKRVVLGGEPIQVAMLEKLPLPRPAIINSYGPTECSDVVAWYTADTDLGAYRNRSIPIGRPIRNMQLHVLDAHGQLLPTGVPGEIHIGGVGVARGYLNLEAINAERFLVDPFSEQPNARMYKTGDLGRYLPDG
ncbi:Amino acid adenylation, partial [Pseudomonas savastanoi pv. glycinea]